MTRRSRLDTETVSLGLSRTWEGMGLLGWAYLSTTCLERSVKKGDHRSNGFVTDPRKLLIWWPMVTDHPFSSSWILSPAGTENPRVGGSIPSQATTPNLSESKVRVRNLLYKPAGVANWDAAHTASV
jgi:hypothetical protein